MQKQYQICFLSGVSLRMGVTISPPMSLLCRVAEVVVMWIVLRGNFPQGDVISRW